MATKKFSQALTIKRINEVYKDTGLNQMNFAKKVGMTQASISRYLSCATPHLKAIFKIAEATGVSSDYLLGLSDNKRSLA